MKNYPFHNYKGSITEAYYFVGRNNLLREVESWPFKVRILLGGRRIGKTSTLHAIQRQLLESKSRAFPVILNMNSSRPSSLENFLYILINKIRLAIREQKGIPTAFSNKVKKLFQQINGGKISVGFLSLDIDNPDKNKIISTASFRSSLLELLYAIRGSEFDGVCLLIDDAEYIVQQDWGNDAWSYLRALIDGEDSLIKSFFGLYLSGYKSLHDYQQKVGSPLLNIANIHRLEAFSKTETSILIRKRYEIDKLECNKENKLKLFEWGGCHPYLTQQLLNKVLAEKNNISPQQIDQLSKKLVWDHDADFSHWWDVNKAEYGFTPLEQNVYSTLSTKTSFSVEKLAKHCDISIANIQDAIDTLTGTGVVLRLSEDSYKIGSLLFSKWVKINTSNN